MRYLMSATSIRLEYGHTQLSLEIPAINLMGIYEPKVFLRPDDEAKLIQEALSHPIRSPRLRDMVNKGEKIAIVTSDLTRPCPSERLLPSIIKELESAGIPDEDIFIVLALGIHRPMTEAEMEAAVGSEMYRRFRVLNHDLADTVRLGVTRVGTPVEFFRPLVEADFRIGLGNIEFHYFAGYSGGAKAVFPGCASKASVTANHAMMVRKEAAASQLEGNPVRADLEEAANMLGVDFILNVVTDGEHNIVGAYAGHVTAAHRKGCELVASRGKVKIPRLADIVVASAGGHPKDINLYQAQKALDNAGYFVRRGGIIILLGECSEGFENPTFELWMRTAASPANLLTDIQQEFVLGGHKAAAIAAVQQRAAIYMISSFDNELVRQIGMQPFDSPQSALDAAFNVLGAQSQVIVLPQAASILPEIEGALV
jgi:nickel-dependent lactate racemase